MDWKRCITAPYSEVKLLITECPGDRSMVMRLLGNRYLNHEHRSKCPVTGRTFKQSWTAHDRWGSLNSCKNCNPHNFKPIGQRLHELNESRR